MTSREALKELFELAVFDNGCDLDKCKKCSVTLQKNCGSYQYYKIIERVLEILENLLQSKYIQMGFYIELDKPCIMILNEEGKVLDWIDIDFEMLQEVKNV